jgi:hypothetical protein
MSMSQPSFWWQKYGTLAQMAQAAVALLGFVAILFQINEIRNNNRAASARQAFLGHVMRYWVQINGDEWIVDQADPGAARQQRQNAMD